jgi:dipeptidyl aminopeptidase/acylaminoacyl peptidase
MRALLVAVASLLVSSPALAARPMTILDLIGAVRVADPQISPDGSRVLFVRTITDVATPTSTSSRPMARARRSC